MGDNAERQANQVLECLTQNKMPIGFFLGAGCPFSILDSSGKALIPEIRGLTEHVCSALTGKGNAAQWEAVCGQLEAEGKPEPNIEEILSRVRGMQRYIGSGTIAGLDKDALSNLEKAICTEIVERVDRQLPDSGTAYHKLASWIASIGRRNPVEVFTTNYDLLLEQALEELAVPYFDGFVGARRPFFDAYAIDHDKLPNRWTRLWKLHGSMNWRCTTENGVFKMWRVQGEKDGNVAIHPSHLKYEESRKMPYLALIDRLRRFLSTPSSILIMLGYSFGDQHINDAIFQALQGTPSSAAFALMFDTLDKYPDAVSSAELRSNLSLLARDGAVVGTKKRNWGSLADQPSSNLPKGAVTWNKSASGSEWVPTFSLGNFNVFGSFVQELCGSVKEPN